MNIWNDIARITTERDALRARLAEAERLLEDVESCVRQLRISDDIRAFLRATDSADAPRCAECEGAGVVASNFGLFAAPGTQPDIDECPTCKGTGLTVDGVKP